MYRMRVYLILSRPASWH